MANLMQNQTGNTSLMVQEQAGQYLTFLVGDESFAVSILDVKEIIEIVHVTHVPLTPDFIYGVINLRGNVVPVIDLSARLKSRRAEIGKRSCIVLLAIETAECLQTIGMLVNEVREILDIPNADIQPPPDFGGAISTDFIRGMARVDDVFIIMLALNRVLSLEDLSALNKSAQSQESLEADTV